MQNEIELIAQQNEMSVEFVTWFFSEKKVGCGNVWFIMMAAMWEGWKGRCIEMDKLAAENVAQKQYALDCVNAVEHWNSWADKEDQIHNDIEPPATDRIVAGIKADGVEWIEGNEPSEFGRYWVRYETDIGPQYCSAQWMEYNFCASSDTNIHKIWLADHSRSINSLKGVTHYTKLPTALEDQQLREVSK
ncbi:TPA: hypothetical protein ACTW8Y_000509 [Raoultella ornithinolytica]